MILPCGLAAVNGLTPGVRSTSPGVLRATRSPSRTWGRPFRIVLYAADEAAAKKGAKAAFARVAELNLILSDYRADSELMNLCEKAGGPPVEVSADLFEVLKKSDEFAKLTDGGLRRQHQPGRAALWKARRTGEMPKAAEIKKALELVDYRKIKLTRKDAAPCSFC